MGTRGRGGRGGGRGRGMSFSVEALGFGIGESLPGPVLAPPSLFPPLANPPVALRADDSRKSSFSGKVNWDYCVMVKKEIVDWLWDASPFVSVLGTSGDCGRTTARASGVADVERYSDRYQFAQASGDHKDLSCFDWSRLPKELRPGKAGETGTRVKISAAPSEGNKRRKRKGEETEAMAPKKDITKRLAELEEREVRGGEGEEEKGREKRKGEGGGEGGEEGEEADEEEEEDEEMDDGTDYISSYFDNGEGYLDEDEDADDGPTY